MNKLKEITRKVLSYCDIPEDVAGTSTALGEGSCDSYIEYEVIPKSEQGKYDDDFTLGNWIIKNYPEVEGTKILIHLDY